MLFFVVFVDFLLFKVHNDNQKIIFIVWEMTIEQHKFKKGVITMILLDVHTHSIASGHGTHDTITDMARIASEKGLQLFGISDHGPATHSAGTLSYFKNLKIAPKERFGIRILYGAELNILDFEGSVDLDSDTLSGLDYAIASIHDLPVDSDAKYQNTESYIKVMKNPYVKIIGHCHTSRYPVDFPALAQAAQEYHVILEINNASLTPDSERDNSCGNCLHLLHACRSHQLPLLLSSDSHGKEHIGDMSHAIKLLEQVDYPEQLILNYDTRAFLRFMDLPTP